MAYWKKLISTISFLLLIVDFSNAAPNLGPENLGYDNGTGTFGTNSNPHNLSKQSANTIKAVEETRICIFCHTPHGATPQSTLWSRSNPDTMGFFPLFDDARVNDGSNLGINDPTIVDTTKYKNNDINVEYPNGATKLCLSCHDGATAIGTLASHLNDGFPIVMTQDTISDPTKFWNPANGTGMDFSRTHPVSFIYTQAVVDHLNLAGTSKTEDYKLPSSGSRIHLDDQERVQCTVCHDPHRDTNDGGVTYSLPFWRNKGVGANETTDYDLTCSECHIDTGSDGPIVGGGIHNL